MSLAGRTGRRAPEVSLVDDVWAPRVAALRSSGLTSLLERLEAHGVVENFARVGGTGSGPRDMSWTGAFLSDSDLAKWLEAASIAGRADLVVPIAPVVAAAQDADGYLHTLCGHDGVPRYGDLDLGHELYSMGHMIEAAVSHHDATGDRQLLDVAVRIADHVRQTFGPGRDERVELHPELELALCRLARVTGDRGLVDLAAWMLEQPLVRNGLDLESVHPAGHAVRFVYFTSGIAEVALATGEARWRDAAVRLWSELIERHSYCTGALGGRWLGESLGRPFELLDETSYAESCASVAMVHLADRMWRLTADPAVLDQLDVLLYNALPAGVEQDSSAWCYANALAFTGEGEQNMFIMPFEWGSMKSREWYPPRRREWFDVMCCPPNVSRCIAAVPSLVADRTTSRDGASDLTIRMPLAGRITDDAWDVEVRSGWPWSGAIEVEVHKAPTGGSLRIRRPGAGIDDVPTSGTTSLVLPLQASWWTARPELSAMQGKAYLRRGPVVYALDDRALPGVDLRRVSVDPAAPIDDRHPQAIATTVLVDESDTGELYRPLGREAARRRTETTFRPYHAWPNGTEQLRIWLPIRS